MERIPVAVLGATGYAGEIATRILLDHPVFTVVHVGSDRLAGTPLAEAAPSFANETALVLAEDTPERLRASGARAVVLAKKSPDVTQVVPDLLDAGMRLVDIGAEFRLRRHDDYRRWYKEEHACPELLPEAVYGLCELRRDAIARARVVGNPGCYPTSILLPLVPLLRAGIVDVATPLVAVSYSGVSGAGRRWIEGNNNLFWAINENLHSYKALAHQHTGEVDQELSAAAGDDVHLRFVPHLAPLTRGIHSTISCSLRVGRSLDDVFAAWREAYGDAPFVRIRPNPQAVEVANVAYTNYCDLSAAADDGVLVVASVIDNLVKGASGQAVQNLNLMFGLEETTGLQRRMF